MLKHDPIGRDDAGSSKLRLTSAALDLRRFDLIEPRIQSGVQRGMVLVSSPSLGELSQRAPSNQPCAQNRGPPGIAGRRRFVDWNAYRIVIIAPTRTSSADLHRPWRAR